MTEENGGPHGTLIEETLKPLLDKRKEIDQEIIAIEGEAKKKREERKTIDKILRAGDLIENNYSAAQPKRGPRKNRHTYRPSEYTMESARAALESFQGNEFTTRMVAEAAGKDISMGKAIIEALREDGLVRLVGSRHPEGTPPHIQAAHYVATEKG